MWKNKKALGKVFGAILLVMVIIIVIVAIFTYVQWQWDQTHYRINAGQVAIVVDQIGAVMRVEKGPRGWAEKAMWETVKYWNVEARTEEMLSPATTLMNGSITVMDPKPLEGCRYGAVSVTTKDGSNIYLDVTIQWHVDTESSNWKYALTLLYQNYTNEDYYKTLMPAVRTAIRNCISHYNHTTDDLVFSKVEETEAIAKPYVQKYVSNISALCKSIIVDNIYYRRRVPSVDVQLAYQKVMVARKEAEALLIGANATKTAAITVAEGQNLAIQIVANATTQAIQMLLSQNVSSTDAIQYLGLQYTYDSLKRIADAHPDWRITLFIGSPPTQYVIPINPEP